MNEGFVGAQKRKAYPGLGRALEAKWDLTGSLESGEHPETEGETIGAEKSSGYGRTICKF